MSEKMEKTENGNESERKSLLWSALLTCLNITEAEVTSPHRVALQWAARQLWEVGATPVEVEGRALRMRRAYSVPLSSAMLIRHWGEFAAARRVPALVRDRGAVCCRWCDTGWAKEDFGGTTVAGRTDPGVGQALEEA